MNFKKLLKILIVLIILIFLVDFLANKFYWYYSIWYFDMIMHALGGLWLGLFFIYFFPPKENNFKPFLKVLFFVLTIGFGWEIFEFSANNYIASDLFIANKLDSVSDLFFDLAGGIVAILYYLKRITLAPETEVPSIVEL